MAPTASEIDSLIGVIDASSARLGSAHRELLRALVDGDRAAVWRDWGARDMAHWTAMRLGISEWKARRFLLAAHVLPELPLLERALESGDLSIDKVVELARFANPATEARLCRWAETVSPAAVRERADREVRRDLEDVRDAERSRSLRWWWFEEGSRLGLQAELPAADGAVVVKAIERLAEQEPARGHAGILESDARRADALVKLASASIGADPDPDRATLVVHTTPEELASADGSCEIEGGGIVHAETARRLLCDGRLQFLLENAAGDVVGVSRVLRETPRWMMRQLRHRDRECRFDSCGARRFLQAHHIVWRERGGETTLDNMVLLCFFHHKLVHEHGWGLVRHPDGAIEWFRPDGSRYQSGSGPPRDIAVA